MLPVWEAYHKSNEELFEESRNKIPTLTKEWTNFNAHDPGITLLQTFAWLFEMQGRYAAYSGEEHLFKYLKLLGYTRQREQPSIGKVTLRHVTKNFILPRGMKFYAGETVFETIRTEYVVANQLECILRDENLEDITEMIAYLDGGAEKLFSHTPNSHFYLGFSEKIDLSKELRLYFTINEAEYKRNDFNKEMFNMGELKWEAYTEKGWKEIKGVKDQTRSFLKSGYVSLEAPFQTAACCLKEGESVRHYLRCTLIKNEYDLLPCIDYIGINCFQVAQRDTKVVNVYLSGTGKEGQCFLIKHYLALRGEVVVLVKEGTDLWRAWENTPEEKCYEIREKEGLLKEIVFFKAPPKGKKNIRLICYEKNFYPKRLLGNFGMMSHPAFKIPSEIVDRKVMGLDSVFIKEGQLIVQHYHQKRDLNMGKEMDCIYKVSRQGQIVFGDKRHGKLPENKDEQLMITGLAETKGSGGNVKSGTINGMSVEDQQLLGAITVINYEDTISGVEEETQEEALYHFRQNFKEEKRMITASDYEAYVFKTPGLLIHKVRAIESNQLKEEEGHKVIIIVKPYSEEKMPKLSRIYEEVIRAHMEQYRMIGTEIKLVSPTYVGIDVNGLIYKKSGYEKALLEDKIHHYIENAIDSLKTERRFGESINIGTLFGKLESLEGVAYVEQISLTPSGTGAKKSYQEILF